MILCRAIFDFISETEGDLCFVKNDVMEYEKNVSKNWYFGRHVLNDKTGNFPYNFVQKLDLPNDIDTENVYVLKEDYEDLTKGSIIIKIKIESDILHGQNYSDSNQDVTIPKDILVKVKKTKKSNKVLEKYRAISDNLTGSESNELQFKVGDEILVFQDFSSDRIEGLFNGKQGLVSMDKLEKIQMDLHTNIDRKNKWICIYDFNAESSSELSVKHGQNLKFVDRIDNNWFIMSNEFGKIGMVPKNFIKNISVDSQPNFSENSSLKSEQHKSLEKNILSELIKFQNTNEEENVAENLLPPAISNEKSACGEPEIMEKKNHLLLLQEKEIQLTKDNETAENDLRSLKNKYLRQSSIDSNSQINSEELDSIKKNVAFLQEDYKLRLKELEFIREQLKKALEGADSTDKLEFNSMKEQFNNLTKTINTRQKIIEELQQTELKFSEDMKLTLDSFDRTKINQKIKDADYKLIFGDIQAVVDLSNHFYKDLSTSIDLSLGEICIGNVFLKYVDEFNSVYGEYCINYDKKIDLIYKLPFLSDTMRFIEAGMKQLNQNKDCPSTLDNMLVKPFQRFLKYTLFLKSIKDNTAEDHEDYSNINQALIEFDRITHNCNEKKRFKELMSSIFDKSEQALFTKALHCLQKKPKRIVTSIYTPIDDDRLFHELADKFHNFRKSVKFIVENISLIRDNLREILNIYSCITNDLFTITKTSFGSLLAQYLLHCRNAEFHYNKTYMNQLDSLVLKPLLQLLECFSGPKLLIKKRASKYLDYQAARHQMETSSIGTLKRTLTDKVDDLSNEFNVLNSTLKTELAILVQKSSVILHECLANYLQLTTTTLTSNLSEIQALLQTPIDLEDGIPLCRNQQYDILSLIQRNLQSSRYLIHARSVQNSLDGLSTTGNMLRNENYLQTQEDIDYLKQKFNQKDLMFVKKDFKATKNIHVCVCAGNLVGIVKRSDPQQHTTNFLVEVAPKRIGYVPRSYLAEPDVDLFKSVGNVRSLSVRAPDKSSYLTNKRTSLTPSITFNQSHYDMSHSQGQMHSQSIYSTMPAQPDLDTSSPTLVIDPRTTCLNNKIVKVLHKHVSRGETELSIDKGDFVEIMKPSDEHGNNLWCFVRLTHNNLLGYVPRNYLDKF